MNDRKKRKKFLNYNVYKHILNKVFTSRPETKTKAKYVNVDIESLGQLYSKSFSFSFSTDVNCCSIQMRRPILPLEIQLLLFWTLEFQTFSKVDAVFTHKSTVQIVVDAKIRVITYTRSGQVQQES
jgi:hypothetical protein